MCLFAFDLLYLNGRSLLDLTLAERRRLLLSAFQEVEGVCVRMHVSVCLYVFCLSACLSVCVLEEKLRDKLLYQVPSGS